jgi:hypothetical protein
MSAMGAHLVSAFAHGYKGMAVGNALPFVRIWEMKTLDHDRLYSSQIRLSISLPEDTNE